MPKLKFVEETFNLLSRFISNDPKLMQEYPVATLTAMRFLTHAAVNGIVPLFFMGFMAKEYPQASAAMQDALEPVVPFFPVLNMLAFAGMVTSLEYAGRKYTKNLLTGPNFRKDIMIGLSFLLSMQIFSGSDYGRQNAYGDFWNKLSAYNPLMIAFVSFFLVAGLTKSIWALGKESVARLTGACAPETSSAALVAQGVFSNTSVNSSVIGIKPADTTTPYDVAPDATEGDGLVSRSEAHQP